MRIAVAVMAWMLPHRPSFRFKCSVGPLKCMFAAALFAASIPPCGVAQVHLGRPAISLTRDEAGLALLRSSLNAMSASGAVPLKDITTEWNVSTWMGKDVHGHFHEEALGASYRYTLLSLDDGTSISYRHIGMVGVQQSAAKQEQIGDERNLQSLLFIPALLIPEILNSPIDSIRLNSGSPAQVSCLSVDLRTAKWTPAMGNLNSTQLTMCFDEQTHLLNSIDYEARFDGDPLHKTHRRIGFSDYGVAHGWLLPRAEVMTQAGFVGLRLSASSQKINSGVIATLVNQNQ